MPGSPLTRKEFVRLFELIDQQFNASALDGMDEALKAEGNPPTRDSKTITKTLNVTRKLWMRDQSLRPLQLDEDEIKELVGTKYGSTRSQIEKVTAEYFHWRHEKRVESELKRHRLDRILHQMWIPELPLIPWDLLALGNGFHGRDLRGRFLRWVQSTSHEDKKPGARSRWGRGERFIRVCWMSEDDLRWFREKFLPELDRQDADGLVAVCDSLHADTIGYLNRAAKQANAEVFDNVEYTLNQARAERFDSNFPEKGKSGQQEMDYLLNEPIRLQDRLVKFQDSVQMRMETIGAGHVTTR